MKALVIAGGLPQIELIKQLRQRGIETLLADGSPYAVARPFADKFFHVDVFDIEAIKSIAQTEKVAEIPLLRSGKREPVKNEWLKC